MSENTIRAIKRRLRESPNTSHAYHSVARLTAGARMAYNRYRFGRNYPVRFFDRLFACSPDPWGYQGDPVSEERKALLLDLLPADRIPRLLELGCASGWMTAELAQRADAVTAIDISPVALSLAAVRCAQWRHVTFRRVDLFTETPEGTFDMIVCAGVLVFLPWAVQATVRDRLVALLTPQGSLLLEHTRETFPGESEGRRIHELYEQHSELRLVNRRPQNIYEALLFRRIVTTTQSRLDPQNEREN